MFKKTILLSICTIFQFFVHAQVLVESFNDDTQFTKSEAFFTDNNDDYFGILDSASTNTDFDGAPLVGGIPNYTGNTNSYLVGEDLDSNGGSAIRTLTWTNLDISNYTNLTLSVNLAADTGGFDANDQILFEVNIDGTGYTSVILFSGSGTNSTATNGSIDLSTNFVTVTENINTTGSTLDLRLTVRADSNNEEFAIDEIVIDGNLMSCGHSITSFVPSNGPIGTEVTVNGTNFTTLSVVNFNGNAANTEFINSTILKAIVPSGTTTGLITVTDSSCITNGTVFSIVSNSTDCNVVFSDIIISEVYDAGSGSLGYVELYNGTGADINLSDYQINRYANLTGPVNTTFIFPNITINNNDVLIGKISASGDTSGVVSDFSFINSTGINANDRLELVLSSNGMVIDDWHEDNVPGTTGYSYLRNTTVTNPNVAYDINEWTMSSTENTADLGAFNRTITNDPSITLQPVSLNTCADELNLNVTALAGNGGILSYQWFFNDGISASWLPANASNFPLATVNGETTNSFTLSNGINNYSGYQFYCQVTESGLCAIASNAAQLKISIARWDGSNWTWNNANPLNTLPTLNDNVILDATIANTNISACNLTINNGNTLTINNGNYVEVINDVTVNANARITTETRGSFIQRGNGTNAGNFLLDPSASAYVNKTTAPKTNWYDVTYWSSPVENESTDGALFPSSRVFWFNANNYLDLDNNSLDDNVDAWVREFGDYPMNPGQGFIASQNQIGFVSGNAYNYIFDGAYNTGDITYPVSYNSANSIHWNLIGNPYPSAIDADDFFALNGASGNQVVVEALYMWSQVNPVDAANLGNEVLNYNQNDYITINSVAEAGNGTTLPPSRQIPSGQAFFIPSSANGNVTFTNNMRVSGTNANTEFYRTTNTASTDNTIEKLWLNLSSDVGIYSQICIAYAENATDNYDGNAIDTYRNYAGNAGTLYSLDNNGDGFYVIQGKAKSSLNLDETIKIGFGAYITSNETYTIEAIKRVGDFLETNTVFIKDNLLNTIHNLNETPYNFNSDGGNFDQRFEIVFQNQALSTNDTTLNKPNIRIINLENNTTQFKVLNSTNTIEHITIFDLQGRLVFNFKANNNSKIVNLASIKNQVIIAKIKLDNGNIITKKTIIH